MKIILELELDEVDVVTCALAYLRDNGPHKHDHMNISQARYDKIFSKIEKSIEESLKDNNPLKVWNPFSDTVKEP